MLNSHFLLASGIALLALGLLLMAGVLLAQQWARARRERVIHRAMERRTAVVVSEPDDAGQAGTPWQEPGHSAHWLESRLGRALVVDEDRRLIEQCGFPALKAQLWFLFSRLGLAMGLPLLYGLLSAGRSAGGMRFFFWALALTVGFLGPKWFLSWYAARRKERVIHELPLFVDLIRLLQGVGLSLDQSLQVIANDFRGILRVLGKELETANRQYSQGRTREHSLQRLAQLHDNENMVNLMALLVQVDRHGGAVQEPLRQFSERLRERRRAELKDRIGKITVKMTGIMVTTLLPALIIVTAGPGFLAVIRSLGAMAR
ncbi:type II secretion system F family protein [Variovorax terrae]|uniref:Type II secretion system F family protein n=1 Tax=Variovorax terrae TaxID=2923278 RepID=A0A9X2AN01_9BURK|nr:type II secretion system F family protein [Variovorax terrae]MCJ0763909.1 type II secretion system F family protein [Variovorax terrae]